MAALFSTEDFDLALAIQLQEEEDLNYSQVFRSPNAVTQPQIKDSSSIASPSWEMIDPVPDVHALFLQFNTEYFEEKLTGIEVKWSRRMTLCAGLCSYEGNGGLCSVRLSEPLLKLRPRKDLVQTLLHEMIHAYLFVTVNDRDHDAHGPQFLSHMHRINQLSGANITVYHNFHEEVRHYKTHWWLCDGPCRQRAPYHGYVKRAMNRAPGPYDNWWSEHQSTCGGTFIKIKEPEGFSDKKRKKEENYAKSTKRQNVGPKNSESGNFVPFSGSGHVLGSSSGTKIKSEPIQQTISNFFEPIQQTVSNVYKTQNVIPQVNERKKVKQNRTESNNNVISLDEYFRLYPSKSLGNSHSRHSVAKKKNARRRPRLIISDSDSDCEEIFLEETKNEKSSLVEKKVDKIPPVETNIVESPPAPLSPECPVCSKQIEIGSMNQHLDICLMQQPSFNF